MVRRPIVCVVCMYGLFLVWVLIWQPELGNQLFRWEEKEYRLKEQYENQEKVEGLVLWIQEKQEGGRAKLRLSDESECMLILTEEEWKAMEAGRYIEVTGEIWWPEAATNPGQWDGRQYARIQHIDFYMRVLRWEYIEKEGSHWLRMMDRFHRWLSQQIEMRWDGVNGQIVKAMLLGDKGAMEEETTELFRKGGISHIIAISGLHLTIISEILKKILERFQRPKPVQVEVTVFLWLYALLTGASVSIMRAAIMVSIRTVAVLLDREEDSLNTLALTAGILLVKQPLYILDAGFALSFAALLGMKYGRILLMSIRIIPYRIRRVLAAPLGIAYATMPLSLWFFCETSVYGFILNFWVIPAMGILLMGVLGSVGLSGIHPALGQGLAAVVEFLLFTFQKGSEWISCWPGAQMRGQPELYQMMALYGIWLMVLWYHRYPYKKMRRIHISFLGILLGLIVRYRPSFWRIMYLDVGQGDCAVIEWNKNVFIIDAGPGYEDVLKPYLMYRGIREIDGVILSHSDWDHLEGLLTLSDDEDFVVRRLWVANDSIQMNENLMQLEENIRAEGGSVRRVNAGYDFRTKGFSLKVLSPLMEHEDTNEGSLVVEVEVEGRSFLFPGDIGKETEQEISQQLQDIDVLKVAHHGSQYSTSEGFLWMVEPELAVISCGRNNRYGHPHAETLERLEEKQIEYYVTAKQGAIWIEEVKDQLVVRHYIAE